MNSPGPSTLSQPNWNSSRSGHIIAACAVILVLTTSCLCVRLWARSISQARFDWNDALLIPSWLFNVGSCVIGFLFVRHGGAGRHIQAAIASDPSVLVTRAKLIYAISWVTSFSNVLSRVSIAALYLQIFRTRTTRALTWAMVALLTSIGVSQALVFLLQYIPISYAWRQFETPPESGRSMIDQFAFLKAQLFADIGADLGLLFLPVSTVWKLRRSIRCKMGLAIVFASGGIGTVAALARTVVFFVNVNEWAKDPTWIDVDLTVWTIVSSGMYLVSACLVGARPFFVKAVTWVEGSSLIFQSLRAFTKKLLSRDSGGFLYEEKSRDSAETVCRRDSGRGIIVVRSEITVESVGDLERAVKPPWESVQ